MPKTIEPKKQYAAFFNWLNSDLTNKFFEGTRAETEYLRRTLGDLETALNAHTSDDPKLTQNAVKALDDALKEIENADKDYDGLRYNGLRAYLNFGKAVLKHTKECSDPDVQPTNTLGNEFMSGSFGAEKMTFADEYNEMIGEEELNELFIGTGYDKVFNAAAERVELSTRLATNVVSDAEYYEVMEQVKDANTKLSEALNDAKEKLGDYYEDGAERNALMDELGKSAETVSEQNDALDRGWDVSRIDDYQPIKKTIQRINNEVAMKAVEGEIEDNKYHSLKSLMRSCKAVVNDDITAKEFTDRREFEKNYLSFCTHMANLDRASKNKDIGKELRDINADLMPAAPLTEAEKKAAEDGYAYVMSASDMRATGDNEVNNNSTVNNAEAYKWVKHLYSQSVFADLANRKKGESDIYSDFAKKGRDTFENAKRLKGNFADVAGYSAMVRKVSEENRYDNIRGEIIPDIISKCRIMKGNLDKARTPEIMSNKQFNRLSTALSNICSWEKKRELTAEEKKERESYIWNDKKEVVDDKRKEFSSATGDLSFNEIKKAMEELKNAVDDYNANGPELSHMVNNSKTTLIENALLNTLSNAAVLSNSGLNRIKRAAAGSRLLSEPDKKFSELIDENNNDHANEIEALNDRIKSVKAFGEAVAKSSDAYRAAYVSLVSDNKERKADFDPATEDKRSDSYLELISSVKLLSIVTRQPDSGEYTPEQIIAAYDNAITAAESYDKSHSGWRGMFKAYTQEGIDRRDNARTIAKELKQARMDLQEAFCGLRDMNKGETLREAIERFGSDKERLEKGGEKQNELDLREKPKKLTVKSFLAARADITGLMKDSVDNTDISRSRLPRAELDDVIDMEDIADEIAKMPMKESGRKKISHVIKGIKNDITSVKNGIEVSRIEENVKAVDPIIPRSSTLNDEGMAEKAKEETLPDKGKAEELDNGINNINNMLNIISEQ